MRHSWNLAVIVPFIITSLFLTSTAVCLYFHERRSCTHTIHSAHGEPLKNAEDVLFEDRIVSVDEVKRAISEDEGPLHTLHERQAGSTWWFANIFRNGTVPFGNTSYILFRNVKSYGAIGQLKGLTVGSILNGSRKRRFQRYVRYAGSIGRGKQMQWPIHPAQSVRVFHYTSCHRLCPSRHLYHHLTFDYVLQHHYGGRRFQYTHNQSSSNILRDRAS